MTNDYVCACVCVHDNELTCHLVQQCDVMFKYVQSS